MATQEEIKSVVSMIRKTPSEADPDEHTGGNVPKIVVGQQFALRLGFFAHHCKKIQRTNCNHTVTIGTTVNITRIGRFYDNLGTHTISDLPNAPDKFDNKNSRGMLEDIEA